jgi:Family of unknown function (DUF6082)
MGLPKWFLCPISVLWVVLVRSPVRKAARATLVVSLAVLALGLILISPLGLKAIAVVKGLDWVKLGNVGQAYGAISAVISGVALAGVTLSLFLQVRDFNLSRMQVMRNYHADLMRFSIENPSFISSWGFRPAPDSDLERVRRIGFTNMIVGFWKDSYETRTLDDGEIHFNFSQLFQGEVGREYWVSSRRAWAEVARTRRSRRFIRIVQEEYGKAISSGPPVVPADLASYLRADGSRSLRKRLGSGRVIPIAGGFALGILSARFMLRRR